jgi:pSer/pThr/pTyr-binding forkhead associated (FHA) protein
MIELSTVTDGARRVVLRVGAKTVYVGRAPQNDVVLIDDAVSSRHLAVWCSGSSVYLEDLASRNGTWIGEDRVTGIVEVQPRTAVRIGGTVFELGDLLPTDAGHELDGLVIEDLDSGVRMPVRSSRVVLGQVVLVIHADGLVQLGEGDELADLAIDQPFEASGQRLCVRRATAGSGATRTRDLVSDDVPISIVATLDGPTGPQATIHDAASGSAHVVTAGNRAVLLYLLARRYQADVEEGRPVAERGWCSDADVVRGVWGKAEVTTHLNNLNVLVSRTRGELRKADIDPWFIEKRPGFSRVRVSSADVS